MSALIGDIKKIPQEKGPEVELAIFGDEFYSRYENKYGYAAIYDEERGLFTYAEVVEGRYISTGVPITEKPPANLKPHLKESNEVTREKAQRRLERRQPPSSSR